jgi:hypothetical protein
MNKMKILFSSINSEVVQLTASPEGKAFFNNIKTRFGESVTEALSKNLNMPYDGKLESGIITMDGNSVQYVITWDKNSSVKNFSVQKIIRRDAKKLGNTASVIKAIEMVHDDICAAKTVS